MNVSWLKFYAVGLHPLLNTIILYTVKNREVCTRKISELHNLGHLQNTLPTLANCILGQVFQGVLYSAPMEQVHMELMQHVHFIVLLWGSAAIITHAMLM